MNGQGLSILVVSVTIFIAAVVAAIKCKRFRTAAIGVAGAAVAVVTTLFLFFVADKEHRRSVKVRQTVKEIKEGRKDAEEDRKDTEDAITEEVEKETEVHEDAKEEQASLDKPKRTRLKT